MHKSNLSVGRYGVDDTGAQVPGWGIVTEKWPKNSSLGLVGFGDLVGDFVDETRQRSVCWWRVRRGEYHIRFKPNNIAHQLAFIPLIITHPASPVDHLDTCHPLVDC